MRFCVSCGAQLAQGAAFCTSCGQATAPAHTAPSGPQTAPLPTSRPGAGSAPQAGAHQGPNAPGAFAQGPDAPTQAAYASAPPVAQPQVTYASAPPIAQEQGAQPSAPPVAPQQAAYASVPPAAPQQAPFQSQQAAQQTPFQAQPAPQQMAYQGGGAATAMPRPQINWTDLLPTLLRSGAAVALALTAIGNVWTRDGMILMAPDTMTHDNVLALIGCVGVTVAALLQVVLSPRAAGGTVPPAARLAAPLALCLPGLIAVIINIVSTFGNAFENGNASLAGIAPTLLAFAIGFIVANASAESELFNPVVLGYVASGAAGLGILGTLVSEIQFLGSDSTARTKWLVGAVSFLFLVGVAGVVILRALRTSIQVAGLAVALAGSVAVAMLLRAWLQDNMVLTATTLVRDGHGSPLIALALGTATFGVLKEASESERAVQNTIWVIPALVLASVSSLVTALVFVGKENVDSAGRTWFIVLMFLTSLTYAACAFLLKTNPFGRLATAIAIPTVALCILITYAAATSSLPGLEPFSEGAFLWLPLAAVLALTVLPSVRRTAGPLMPTGVQTTNASEVTR